MPEANFFCATLFVAMLCPRKTRPNGSGSESAPEWLTKCTCSEYISIEYILMLRVQTNRKLGAQNIWLPCMLLETPFLSRFWGICLKILASVRDRFEGGGGGSKAPQEPPGLHRGIPEPPVDLVGKDFLKWLFFQLRWPQNFLLFGFYFAFISKNIFLFLQTNKIHTFLFPLFLRAGHVRPFFKPFING